MSSNRKPPVIDEDDLENDEPADEGYASFMAAFDFTPEELAANRQGMIVERQRRRLSGTSANSGGCSRTMTAAAITFLLIAYSGIFFWLLSNPALRRDLTGDPLQLTLLLLAFIIPLVTMLYAHLWMKSTARRMVQAPLLRAQGRANVQKISNRAGAAPALRLRISQAQFSFPERVGSLFTSGAEYIIYYVKTGPYSRILSVELKAPST